MDELTKQKTEDIEALLKDAEFSLRYNTDRARQERTKIELYKATIESLKNED